jgi:anti-sigma28 factor (negative regulator of flagellin synthesis)
MPDKIQIPQQSSLEANPEACTQGKASSDSSDVVTELECSAAVEALVDQADVARQKKIAALKKQHQEGTLKPQASSEVAERIIKKFNL